MKIITRDIIVFVTEGEHNPASVQIQKKLHDNVQSSIMEGISEEVLQQVDDLVRAPIRDQLDRERK